MFTKILKYDFQFSKTAFLATAAMMLGAAVIIKIASLFFDTQVFEWFFAITAILVLVIVVLATVSQVSQFFYKNFFDDAGYLMLTLPVTRGKLLASKFIVSMVWMIFMLVTGFIALFLFAWAQDLDGSPRDFFNAFDWIYVTTYIQVVFGVLLIISIVFLAITLAHSVFGRFKVQGFVAGIAAILYSSVALFFGIAITQRRSDFIIRQYTRNIYDDYGYVVGTYDFGWGEYYRETGLRIGRIPIGDTGAFIDIFHWGLILGMTALAIAGTYWLLKKKASLG